MRSNILFELKRDIGMAESALMRPESSSEVRNHELVSIGTEVSSAFVIWAAEGAACDTCGPQAATHAGPGRQQTPWGDSGGAARLRAAARSERKA